VWKGRGACAECAAAGHVAAKSHLRAVAAPNHQGVGQARAQRMCYAMGVLKRGFSLMSGVCWLSTFRNPQCDRWCPCLWHQVGRQDWVVCGPLPGLILLRQQPHTACSVHLRKGVGCAALASLDFVCEDSSSPCQRGATCNCCLYQYVRSVTRGGWEEGSMAWRIRTTAWSPGESVWRGFQALCSTLGCRHGA
jgi:hypothetical protein